MYITIKMSTYEAIQTVIQQKKKIKIKDKLEQTNICIQLLKLKL